MTALPSLRTFEALPGFRYTNPSDPALYMAEAARIFDAENYCPTYVAHNRDEDIAGIAKAMSQQPNSLLSRRARGER